jgi:hypothetical protein
MYPLPPLRLVCARLRHPPASSSRLSLLPHQPPFSIHPLALAFAAIIIDKFGTRSSHERCVTRYNRFISGSRRRATCRVPFDALRLHSTTLSILRFRVQREPQFHLGSRPEFELASVLQSDAAGRLRTSWRGLVPCCLSRVYVDWQKRRNGIGYGIQPWQTSASLDPGAISCTWNESAIGEIRHRLKEAALFTICSMTRRRARVDELATSLEFFFFQQCTPRVFERETCHRKY